MSKNTLKVIAFLILSLLAYIFALYIGFVFFKGDTWITIFFFALANIVMMILFKLFGIHDMALKKEISCKKVI